ncbi:MAG: hypothetical protein WCJ30_15400, partial [Deltaproteobacteria bacterium]
MRGRVSCADRGASWTGGCGTYAGGASRGCANAACCGDATRGAATGGATRCGADTGAVDATTGALAGIDTCRDPPGGAVVGSGRGDAGGGATLADGLRSETTMGGAGMDRSTSVTARGGSKDARSSGTSAAPIPALRAN